MENIKFYNLSVTNTEDFLFVSLSVSCTLWIRIKMYKEHCFHYTYKNNCYRKRKSGEFSNLEENVCSRFMH